MLGCPRCVKTSRCKKNEFPSKWSICFCFLMSYYIFWLSRKISWNFQKCFCRNFFKKKTNLHMWSMWKIMWKFETSLHTRMQSRMFLQTWICSKCCTKMCSFKTMQTWVLFDTVLGVCALKILRFRIFVTNPWQNISNELNTITRQSNFTLTDVLSLSFVTNLL